MGIAVQHVFLQAALFHGLHNVLTHPGGAVTEEVVGDQALFDDLAHSEAGVQTGVGVLENDLQVLAQLAHLSVFQTGQVNAVVPQALVILELLVVRIGGAQSVKLSGDLVHLGLSGSLILLQGGQLRLGVVSLLFQSGLLAGVGLLILLFEVLGRHLVQAYLLGDLVALLAGLKLLVQQIDALLVLAGIEAAQDLHQIADVGLHLALGQMLGLQQIEVRGILAAGLLHLLVKLFVLLGGFFQLAVLLVMADGILHIAGGHAIQRGAVIERAAGRLGIELQQNASEGRFSAAGLAHDTQGLALIDIDGDILIRAHIQRVLLEDGGFGYRKILLQISD